MDPAEAGFSGRCIVMAGAHILNCTFPVSNAVSPRYRLTTARGNHLIAPQRFRVGVFGPQPQDAAANAAAPPNSHWSLSLLPPCSPVDPPSNIVGPEGIHVAAVGNLQLEPATTGSLSAVEKYFVARAAYVWRAKGPRPGSGH
jgi:hypothetical protein